MKYRMITLLTMTMIGLLFVFAMLDIDTSTRITGFISHSLYTLLNLLGGTGYDAYEINFFVRKMGHFGFYTLLSAMIAIFFFLRVNKLFTAVILSGVVTLVLSFMDEFIQHFAIGRNASYLDIVIDMAGAVIGLMIFTATLWAVEKKERGDDLTD